jgi:hypothetical protein
MPLGRITSGPVHGLLAQWCPWPAAVRPHGPPRRLRPTTRGAPGHSTRGGGTERVLGGDDLTDVGRPATVAGLRHGVTDSSGAWTSARRPNQRGVDGEVARLASMSTTVSGL